MMRAHDETNGDENTRPTLILRARYTACFPPFALRTDQPARNGERNLTSTRSSSASSSRSGRSLIATVSWISTAVSELSATLHLLLYDVPADHSTTQHAQHALRTQHAQHSDSASPAVFTQITRRGQLASGQPQNSLSSSSFTSWCAYILRFCTGAGAVAAASADVIWMLACSVIVIVVWVMSRYRCECRAPGDTGRR